MSSMRKLNHPTKENITLTDLLYALSDPTRLTLVKSIAANGEQPCGTFDVPVAKSTLSHHFKVLRESGVITMRQEGVMIINSLRQEELNERFPGLLDSILQAANAL
jgi:DNA-binding transcriptional ArsR family regulator